MGVHTQTSYDSFSLVPLGYSSLRLFSLQRARDLWSMYASYEEDKKHRSSEKWDAKYDGMRLVSKAKEWSRHNIIAWAKPGRGIASTKTRSRLAKPSCQSQSQNQSHS